MAHQQSHARFAPRRQTLSYPLPIRKRGFQELLTIVILAGFAAARLSAQESAPTRPANPPRAQVPSKPPSAVTQEMSAPAAAPTNPPRRPGVATQPPSTVVRPGQPSAKSAGPALQEPAVPKLSQAEQAELNQMLEAWDRESDKVKTLSADFTMWEYDAVFGPKAEPGKPPQAKRSCTGHLHFAAPDRGSYQITTEGNEERWVCDGKAIYQFDYKQKKLKEYPLPKNLQGKAITNGPLPFVFGAKAEDMRNRYWMRIFTRPEVKDEIWIEAWPRWQQDAANFHHVQVILDAKSMLPKAIRLYEPNPNIHKVYAFGTSTKVNGTLDQIKGFFARPNTPFGWQHVVEEPPQQALPAGQPGQPAAAAAAAPRPNKTQK